MRRSNVPKRPSRGRREARRRTRRRSRSDSAAAANARLSVLRAAPDRPSLRRASSPPCRDRIQKRRSPRSSAAAFPRRRLRFPSNRSITRPIASRGFVRRSLGLVRCVVWRHDQPVPIFQQLAGSHRSGCFCRMARPWGLDPRLQSAGCVVRAAVENAIATRSVARSFRHMFSSLRLTDRVSSQHSRLTRQADVPPTRWRGGVKFVFRVSPRRRQRAPPGCDQSPNSRVLRVTKKRARARRAAPNASERPALHSR
jgi:hypothetical protein